MAKALQMWVSTCGKIPCLVERLCHSGATHNKSKGSTSLWGLLLRLRDSLLGRAAHAALLGCLHYFPEGPLVLAPQVPPPRQLDGAGKVHSSPPGALAEATQHPRNSVSVLGLLHKLHTFHYHSSWPRERYKEPRRHLSAEAGKGGWGAARGSPPDSGLGEWGGGRLLT